MQMHGVNGRRRDGRNLIEEWQNLSSNRTFVQNRDELKSVDVNSVGQLFGLFAWSHLPYNLEVLDTNREDIPSLKEMTEKAIEVLQRNENGFFLMVEAGRIDHGHHETRARRALDETLEYEKAIQSALDMLGTDDTLIVVSADHSHVFTYAGYPVRLKLKII
jgi:alkaline phosphatase